MNDQELHSKGHLFIVAAPSGAGKTSLVRALVSQLKNLRISISYTTRPPRPSEVDKQHYFFVDSETFHTMLAQKLFLEHAEVFGHFYGTPAHWVQEQLAQGQDIILEIDWQGAMQIKRLFPDSVVGIFILPPSLSCLKERLIARGQDQEEIISKRMRAAQSEIQHWESFDYLVVNEDFDQCVAEMKAIIQATRLSCAVQKSHLGPLIQNLLADTD